MEENKQVFTQKQELKNEKVNFEGTFWVFRMYAL